MHLTRQHVASGACQARRARAAVVAAPGGRPRHAARPPAATAAPEGLSYKAAGVDIAAGDELVRRIQKLNPSIGGFSGLVPFGDSFLVAGTDGVGTKLKLAFDMNKHDTVGIDLVAMSVNDIVTSGAAPMFFLDYYATGALDVDAAEQVIKGIVEGCRQSGCQLLGGETAEMPGFYAAGEYDLAGFAVGSVKQDRVIDGKSIAPGDVVLGMASSGVHSNGFSLVRKVLEVSGTSLHDPAPWGGGITAGAALLEPTVIYVKRVLALHDKVPVKGLVHITGGGMTENIPRVIPKGLGVQISTSAWALPPMFQWIQESGRISDAEMRRTFNCGIGMVAVVPPEAVAAAKQADPGLFELGKVVTGSGVTYV
ncbi:PUR5 [Scenedesmus sp. PABB004]|nr:PUR5 [Scenedesmus sp. PABB004]